MELAWRDFDWELLPAPPLGVHQQLALDELLLRDVAAGARPPAFRTWSWTQPALVLGSHQSVLNEVDEEAAADLGYRLARRLSGGGTMVCGPGSVITWSIYAPEQLVSRLSFVESYRALDGWVVSLLRELGVDAGYRPINDICCPAGKIAGAAQARRRGHVLHHVTMAYRIDPELVPRLIRIGRPARAEHGVRSAEKQVAPLGTLIDLPLARAVEALETRFAELSGGAAGVLGPALLAEAEALAAAKYAAAEWIHRLA